MGVWKGPQGDGGNPPSGDKQDGPTEEKYLGLTATQFNVGVLGVVGVVAAAVGLFLFGGASAMQDMFTGDDESSTESAAVVQTATPTATVVPSSPAPSPSPDTATPAPSPTDDIDNGGGGGSSAAVEQILDTFDPFTLMGALGSSGSPADISITGPGGTAFAPSDQADESLMAILVKQGDLPPGFSSLGEMSFSVPTGQANADMAASMFATGDLDSADFGTMVMSAVMVGPDITAELGGFDELEAMTQADLDEAAAAMEEFGVSLVEMEFLDASGLGDAGMGMHMVMDFSGMFDAFDMPEDDSVPDGIALDMYAFVRGERLLMAMVMWLPDAAPVADAHALAEIMDARAAAQ